MQKQDFLTLAHWQSASLARLLDLALEMKQNPTDYHQVLAGKSIVTLYEKPSLRTRVSFDVGIQTLGGHSVYLDQQNGALGQRESVKDFALNLTQWCDGIVARVNAHSTLEQLAQHAEIPVINALCNLYHPCQAMADFLTLQETYQSLKGLKLAYVGDGNNVCHSLMILAAKLGVNMSVITPVGYGPDAHVLMLTQSLAQESGAQIQLGHDLSLAQGHNAIYTDTWISMGEQKDKAKVLSDFAAYQINQDVIKQLHIEHFMHCQPVYRGVEVTDEVADSDKSLLMLQAANRMYAQNAILAQLVGGVK